MLNTGKNTSVEKNKTKNTTSDNSDGSKNSDKKTSASSEVQNIDNNIIEKMRNIKKKFREKFESFLKSLDKLLQKKEPTIHSLCKHLDTIDNEKTMTRYANMFKDKDDSTKLLTFDKNIVTRTGLEIVPGVTIEKITHASKKVKIKDETWLNIVWKHVPLLYIWGEILAVCMKGNTKDLDVYISHASKMEKRINSTFDPNNKDESTNSKKEKDDDSNKNSDIKRYVPKDKLKKSKKSDSSDEEQKKTNNTEKNTKTSNKPSTISTDNLSQIYKESVKTKIGDETNKSSGDSGFNFLPSMLGTGVIGKVLEMLGISNILDVNTLHARLQYLNEDNLKENIKQIKKFIKRMGDEKYSTLFKRLVKATTPKLLELKDTKFKSSADAIKHISATIKEIHGSLGVSDNDVNLKTLALAIISQVQKDNSGGKKGKQQARFLKLLSGINLLIKTDKEITSDLVMELLGDAFGDKQVVTAAQVEQVMQTIKTLREEKKDMGIGNIIELINGLDINLKELLPKLGFGDSSSKKSSRVAPNMRQIQDFQAMRTHVSQNPMLNSIHHGMQNKFSGNGNKKTKK